MIGLIVDKYEVLQKIGEGGMATVYRGRHTTLDRDVAIKVLHPHLSSTERNRQRFAREAEAIERLDHNNILKILDYSGNQNQDCYIVTEYIEGVTLRELLEERGKFPSEIVALIGIDLLKALHYAHSFGLVHRDLKPENVMIRRDGIIKLMDFGIARFLDESQLTITGTLVGSPAYMSPEQAMEKEIDARSDLFSLGTLLYHLTCGRLPFQGSNPSIVLKNIIENNYSPASDVAVDISPSLADLIESLLQTEPADRIVDYQGILNNFCAIFKEGNVDISQAKWKIQTWLSDPTGYEEALNKHLIKELLATGKERIEKKDHLGTHRLFNRLLSIDETNPHVPELLQVMYSGQEASSPKRRSLLFWFLPLVATGLLSFYYWPTQQEIQTEISPPSVVEELPQSQAEPPRESLLASNDDTLRQTISNENFPKDSMFEEINKVIEETTTEKTKPKAVNTAKVKKKSVHKKLATKEKPKNKVIPPEPQLTPPKEGKVIVTVPNSWAYVIIDGHKHGTTGQIGEINLPEGEHTLKLENPMAIPYEQKFTVVSGETKTIEVTDLQRKPAIIIVPKELYDKTCLALIDSISQGSLGGLKYRLSIRDPTVPHNVTLKCNQEIVAVRSIPELPAGSISPFPRK